MKKTITQLGAESFKDKRVLVRVDFNVPQHEDGTVADDSRIRATIPTVKFLKDAGAKVVLASHLGRPKGKEEKYSLRPVAKRVSQIFSDQGLGVVHFVSDCVGPVAEEAVNAMKAGDVCLLENVRFYPGEEKNDRHFAEALADLADLYVSDAFGAVHRAHASTEGVAHLLKPAVAGFLLDREIKMLSQALDPLRPVAFVIGGAKVSSKMRMLQNLLTRVDVLVIGGAMAFSFMKARGLEVGKSLVEDDRLEYCRELEKSAEQEGVDLVLPNDVVVAPNFPKGGDKPSSTIVPIEAIPENWMGLDIGPKTSQKINESLSRCKTVVWNGPMGVFEHGYDVGTFKLIDDLVTLTKKGVVTIIGGGDSVNAIKAHGISETSFSHVSTGGGASLEFLEGQQLPGIACLDDAPKTAQIR
ncbi:MAG TPA: phosphoglycerate kinase [Candidatus Obscuribacterales bacterium]